MTITSRAYNKEKDFDKVGDFLIRTFNNKENFQNWLQPRWEYMHYHPYFYNPDLEKEHNKIRIWEDDGKIVAVVNFELNLGEAYLHFNPEYSHLKGEMLDYAENFKTEFKGRELIVVYINESDDEFKNIAKSKGFEKEEKYTDYMSVYRIPEEFPEITLPEGFKLQSLEDENDLNKANRVLWRGFNHEGEPDPDLSGRKLMQSAPNFKNDLNIVVVAPDGNYVSYCGMWYDDVNKVSYVEPVATDPDYRKMGLGKAAVLEGVRRCGEKGADRAYVTTNKKFYLKIGFEIIFKKEAWVKYFD